MIRDRRRQDDVVFALTVLLYGFLGVMFGGGLIAITVWLVRG